MAEADVVRAVVLEMGSDTCKAGFAGEDVPLALFPSVVGRARHPWIQQMMMPQGGPDVWVGEEAQRRRGVLRLSWPIEQGLVTKWEDLEHIWHHTFYTDLRVAPEELAVLLIEAPLNPQQDRETMVKTMFDKFGVLSVQLAKSAVLALYASGRKTGIVLDSGLGETRAVPVCEGILLPHAVQHLHLGGRDLTERMMHLLVERGWCFAHGERTIIQDMKESLCRVALDPQHLPASEVSFELPCGDVVTLAAERFRTTELLFEPSLSGLEGPGIHCLLLQSIMASDEDLHEELFSNVVLTGGNTLFPGLATRLAQELQALKPNPAQVEVVAPRKHGAWIGGALVSSFSTKSWITREEYQQHGPSIVERCM